MEYSEQHFKGIFTYFLRHYYYSINCFLNLYRETLPSQVNAKLWRFLRWPQRHTEDPIKNLDFLFFIDMKKDLLCKAADYFRKKAPL